MKRKILVQTFLRGLETTGLEDGLPLPAWSVFQNVRLDEGAAKRRPGMQLVDAAPSPHTCLDLNGSSQWVEVPKDTRVHNLKTRWTVEVLCQPDTVTGTQSIVDWDHATDLPVQIYLSGATLTAKCKDSGGTTTLTATVTARALAIQFVRDGDSAYLYVDGVQEDTATGIGANNQVTPGGVLLIGKDNGGNYFDGRIDFVRCLNRAQATRRYTKMRLVDPRAEYVWWDYVMEVAEATTARVDDRSSFENHGEAKGSPSTGTALTVTVLPVALIRPRIDYDNKQRLDVIAGSEIFLAEVAE